MRTSKEAASTGGFFIASSQNERKTAYGIHAVSVGREFGVRFQQALKPKVNFMTLRPFLIALFIALTALPAAAQTDADACTPNADGTVPAGCPDGVALDP